MRTSRPKSESPAKLERTAIWQRSAAAFLLMVCFAATALLTWNRWGDLIIDCGRELDTPRQLSEGKMLYRDIRYWYGPFAPYLNGFLFRIFGTNVQTLTVAGLISAALLVWAAFRICRMFTGRAAAVAGCIAIIFTNIFCQYYPLNIFNFVLPYSYPATYGTLFAALSLLCLLRHVFKGRSSDFYFSCAALSLCALCKVEVLFTAAIMHSLFMLLVLIRRRLKVNYILGYAGAVIIPLAVYGYFHAQIGSLLFSDNLFISGNIAASGFTLRHSGFDDLSASLQAMGICLLAYLAVFSMLLLASKAARIAGSSAEVYYGTISLAALVCAATIYFPGAFLILRALPLALLAALAYYLYRIIKTQRSASELDTALAILFATGLAGMIRIILRAGAEHYGFYLTVPAMIAATILWTRVLPALTARFSGNPDRAYLCGVVVMLALAMTHFSHTYSTATRTFGQAAVPRVRTSMGVMPLAGFYQGSVDSAINDLAEIARGGTVVVIPEGVAITFLAGARNPLGVHTFLPVDFCGTYDEDRMLERLAKANPDYIVLNSRDTLEYGKRGIGIDYAQKFVAWIKEHYRGIKAYRSPANFQTVIMKRK